MSQLKSRIAARLEQRKIAKVKKAAQIRVAAAWTIAKTMLPDAPAEVQEVLASNLMENDIKVLTAALRQTAINAHYTKLAEKLSDVHKLELNDLMEDESLLKKLKNEVEKELKADDPSKIASAKVAEEGDDVAPLDEVKDDMPPVDAPPAEGGELPPPPGDMPPPMDMAPPAPPMDMPPAGGMGMDIPDHAKVELHKKIEDAEETIMDLEHEIMDAGDDMGMGGGELDIAAAFNDDTKAAKRMNLANEEEAGAQEDLFDMDIKWGDDSEAIADPELDHEEQGEDGFFGPSEVESMEASMEGENPHSDMDIASESDAADFFTSGTTASKQMDQLGLLMSHKASDEILKPGTLADHFDSDLSHDDRDSETDHDGSLLHELIGGLDQDEFEDGLDRDDSAPEMSKAASAGTRVSNRAGVKPPAVKEVTRTKGGKPVKLGDMGSSKVASSKDKEIDAIAKALFGDDDY